MFNFRHKKTILLILVLALATVGYVSFSAEPSYGEVAFLNVGQGDAILISLPGEIQILIDGGPSSGSILDALSRHLPFYDRTVELVIVTHPHADHVSGLNAVLERYRVENVMASGVYHNTRTYKYFFELLKREGSKLYLAQRGDQVAWNGKVILTVLSPEQMLLGQKVRDVNQTSVVTALTIGGIEFLLPGDAETPIERELLASELLSDVDVLKISHSGSKGGTSAEFLNTVLPEVAVISVGKNSYGHPHNEVLDRLEALGSKILRTDEQGDIVWRFKAR